MNPNPKSYLSAAALAVAMLLAASVRADDRVSEMCAMAEQAMPGKNRGCACALEHVAGETGEEDFSLYAEVGTAYFEEMANGLSRAEAWDAAARSAGESRGMSLIDVLQITNPIGRLHQDALEKCQ